MNHEPECLGEEACICPEIKLAYQRGLLVASKIVEEAFVPHTIDPNVCEAMETVFEKILRKRKDSMFDEALAE